ncbi:hypothetical protein BV20DRAFT_169257 [Pilatotrama ljubarskyi]|nr:hypothetical protein BV20DRAFT_169257 [Pilatotrama ljubarskyi]
MPSPYSGSAVPLCPVVCFADQENIIPLLLSSLHQRRNLQCTLPIVGVMYAPDVGICQVILGYQSESDRPRFYLAMAGRGAAGSSEGVFDLRSPADMFALAWSIVEIVSQLSCSYLEDNTAMGEDGPVSSVDTGSAWRADRVIRDRSWSEHFDVRFALWHGALLQLGRLSKRDAESGRESSLVREQRRERGQWQPDPVQHSVSTTRLLESKLSWKLNLEHPGIADWSLHHHALTVPFVPHGSSFAHFKFRGRLEDMFAMLYPGTSEPQYRANRPIALQSSGMPPLVSRFIRCDATAALFIATIISEVMLGAPMFLEETMPCYRTPWEELLDFPVAPGSGENEPRLAYHPLAHIKGLATTDSYSYRCASFNLTS